MNSGSAWVNQERKQLQERIKELEELLAKEEHARKQANFAVVLLQARVEELEGIPGTYSCSNREPTNEPFVIPKPTLAPEHQGVILKEAQP